MTTTQMLSPAVRIRAHPFPSLSSERVFFARIPCTEPFYTEPSCEEAAHG
jgi:hypothetical protein